MHPAAGHERITTRTMTLPDQQHIGTGYYGSLNGVVIRIFERIFETAPLPRELENGALRDMRGSRDCRGRYLS